MENKPQILCLARETNHWQGRMSALAAEWEGSVKVLRLDEGFSASSLPCDDSVALTILDLSDQEKPCWDEVFRILERVQKNALLIITDNKPPGALTQRFNQSGLGQFHASDVSDQTLGHAIKALLTQRELTDRITNRAFYDEVTQLPSADLFRDRFETAVHRVGRLGFGFGLALCDIDGFCEINRQKGYGVGDRVLNQVGKRFQDRMRKSDTTARLGGDSFALIFENVIQNETLKRLAEKVFEVVTLPYLVRDPNSDETVEVQLNFSMGLCLFPQHLTEPENIMAAAESALAIAKQKEGSSLSVYEPPEASDEIDLLEANG